MCVAATSILLLGMAAARALGSAARGRRMLSLGSVAWSLIEALDKATEKALARFNNSDIPAYRKLASSFRSAPDLFPPVPNGRISPSRSASETPALTNAPHN